MIDVRVLRVEIAVIVHGFYLRRVKGDKLLATIIDAIIAIGD